MGHRQTRNDAMAARAYLRVVHFKGVGARQYSQLGLVIPRSSGENIEALYRAFNEAGDVLGSDAARQAVVEEANLAFTHNVHVYSEEGALWSSAARGVGNMVGGFARAKLVGGLPS